jgi:argininosuccinate lyase
MKTWDKGINLNSEIEKFTIGHDRELDLLLAPWDVIGSIAHVKMLGRTSLLNADETERLVSELRNIYQIIRDSTQNINEGASPAFRIEDGVEDIHSQLEKILIDRLGDTGRKVHTGRSRNDQILVDIQLFIRHEIKLIADRMKDLFDLLISLSEQNKEIFLPGYTHLQVAMKSSFGIWFGAYAEALADDMLLLQSAYRMVNQNPLGSAAGYGTSLPINRQYTTELLAFDELRYNVLNVQLSRGKIERMTAQALSSICSTLGKLAMDICLFNSQNFGFISLPEDFTTGSSIMPHKKNPDVAELIRARCNRMQALPNDINMVTVNLPSGYHRDYQVLKELLFPALKDIQDLLHIMYMTVSSLKINKQIADNDLYSYASSVEQVNKMVMDGIPFRDAYQIVAKSIADGDYKSEGEIKYIHEGSMGNLCNKEITRKMNRLYESIDYKKVDEAIREIVTD